MSRRVGLVEWDLLLAAYRDDPGNHSAAARAAGVTRRTAKLAWHNGYPAHAWGRKPASQVIAEEQEIARSRLQLVEEQEELEEDRAALDAERDRETARQHAILAKTQEGHLVAGARAASILGLKAAVQSTPGLHKAMERLSLELVKIAEGGPLTHKELVSFSSIMRRWSSTLRELSAAGQMAMEMERLRLGEPGTIIGVVSDYDTMPIQDLVKAAGYHDGVLQRAAARGLVVLQGGKKPED